MALRPTFTDGLPLWWTLASEICLEMLVQAYSARQNMCRIGKGDLGLEGNDHLNRNRQRKRRLERQPCQIPRNDLQENRR